ncbi:hypothetical protein [Humibacillus xanthopallidus]|uniref:hypothetical protein n=1 Tax=Humibacillus xanthopallidus TaxID=412689 RepID=UPI00384BBFF0
MSDHPSDHPDGHEPTAPQPAPMPAPTRLDLATPGLPVFLSTEHWSLLGTRSLTWSEVMSRITIHLTVLSAFLVVLALTAQATDFGAPFRVMAIGFASAALIMGTLTAIRVNTASQEDADLIRAMNRLRHAYVDLAPELAPYLTASIHDDEAGLMHTYALGRPRNVVLHIVGSTSIFLMVVNALVAGTLGALIASAAGAGAAVVSVVGAVLAVAYGLSHLLIVRSMFRGQEPDERFPTRGGA